MGRRSTLAPALTAPSQRLVQDPPLPPRRLSGALVRALLTPGRNASIFGIEETFIIDNGGQPLRSLPPLTNSVTYGWPTIWRR